MKHAVIILSHDHIEQLISLVKYFDDDFVVLIHLDKKNEYDSKQKEILSKMNNVFIYSKFKTNWGGHKLLECELFMLNEALKNPNIDYFHFLSAQDVPTRNLNDLKTFFLKNRGLSFLKYKQYLQGEDQNEAFERLNLFMLYDWFNYRSKTGYYFLNNIIKIQEAVGVKRSIPNHFSVIYGGSAWFSLSRECVKYLISYTSSYPQFYRRLKYTFAADEIYINTVLLNSTFKEKIVNSDLRYVNWQFKNGSIPAVLDEDDLFYILSTENFFARKIDFSISSKLLIYLNKRMELGATKRDKISSTGFWITNCINDYIYNRELSETLCAVLKLMKVQSVVDVGCGSGMYVVDLLDCGFQVIGIDGNPYVKEMSTIWGDRFQNTFLCADVTQNLLLDMQFDAVISIDVGIYLPEEYIAKYIDNLFSLSTKYILIKWGSANTLYNNSNTLLSQETINFEMKRRGAYMNVFCSEYLNYALNISDSLDRFIVFEKL